MVPGSTREIQALVGGSVQFAQVDAVTTVNAINQGADLVMIWLAQHVPVQLRGAKERSAGRRTWPGRRSASLGFGAPTSSPWCSR